MGRRQTDPGATGIRRSLPLLLFLFFVVLLSCSLVYFSASTSSSSSGKEIDGRIELEREEEKDCCRGMEKTELWGSAVKWGTDHRFDSSAQCCRACKSMCGGSGGPCLCDSWVFCGDRDRCGEKFGEVKEEEN